VVTIGMNYFVIAGKEKVFEDACGSVVKVMEDIDGHEESDLFKRVGKDGDPVYLIVSRWQNEAAFKDFIASDQFKKVTNWGKENILSARPRHTTYQEG
jgi:heme-degrading monooxygenase HmoA